MFNFIHGYATLVPGSWLPAAGGDGRLECSSSHCHALWKETWPKLFAEGATDRALLDMECAQCKRER